MRQSGTRHNVRNEDIEQYQSSVSFTTKKHEVDKQFTVLYNVKLCDLYRSLNIVRVVPTEGLVRQEANTEF
jgi:hypothetical protein